jgi:photosystem II stability/assembly factor-like uncharacterized protein
MVSKDAARLLFTEGYVVNKNYVVISSRLASLDDDEEGSRICFFVSGQWFYFDVDLTVRSVYGVYGETRTVQCLGWDGRVHISRGKQVSQEQIPDAGLGRGKFGYVLGMREISGKLYVCGASGQIYRRESSGWAHFDQGVLDPRGPIKSPHLNSIDGTSERDLYAVGKGGLIWHYDGKSWVKLEPPTRHDLTWVRCVASDEVYVCGKNGTFFKGHLNQWKQFDVPKGIEHLWCVEHFEGKIYLAAYEGLFVFDGKRVQQVDTNLEPAPDGHRLHANDGVLWSFGVNHLASFDGNKWTYVKHPDNP